MIGNKVILMSCLSQSNPSISHIEFRIVGPQEDVPKNPKAVRGVQTQKPGQTLGDTLLGNLQHIILGSELVNFSSQSKRNVGHLRDFLAVDDGLPSDRDDSGSNGMVNFFDFFGGSGNQAGASIEDGLAATLANHISVTSNRNRVHRCLPVGFCTQVYVVHFTSVKG